MQTNRHIANRAAACCVFMRCVLCAVRKCTARRAVMPSRARAAQAVYCILVHTWLCLLLPQHSCPCPCCKSTQQPSVSLCTETNVHFCVQSRFCGTRGHGRHPAGRCLSLGWLVLVCAGVSACMCSCTLLLLGCALCSWRVAGTQWLLLAPPTCIPTFFQPISHPILQAMSCFTPPCS